VLGTRIEQLSESLPRGEVLVGVDVLVGGMGVGVGPGSTWVRHSGNDSLAWHPQRKVQSSIQFGVPGHSSLTQREKHRSTSQTQAPGPGCPLFVRHGQSAVGVAVVVSLGSAGTASIVPTIASRQVAMQTRIPQPPGMPLPQVRRTNSHSHRETLATRALSSGAGQ
jgi:hypothetical protein